MNQFLHSLKSISLDGWIFGLTGFVAILFSLISSLGFIPLTTDQTLQIMVGGMGVLLLSAVAQTSKRSSEIQEIKDAIGISDIEVLSTDKEVPHQMVLDSRKAKYLITETFLNWATPRSKSLMYLLEDAGNEYNQVVYKRVTNGEIAFRQVQIVYHKQGLEELIHRLLLHEGSNYQIRHYGASLPSIPMLHVTSFDDKYFYLGIGFPQEQPADNQVLRVRDVKMENLLKRYWQTLWDSAIPLNTAGVIDWQEIKNIGENIGVSESEFANMVENIKTSVKRYKRRKKI